MGFDNPNGAFVFNSDDAADDNELHIWSNIATCESLSNVNVHPATPTTAISIMPTLAISIVTTTTIPIVPTMTISKLNVLLKLELNVYEDVVAKVNMGEAIEEDGNRMGVDEVHPPTCHIHPSSDDVPPPILPTPN